MGVDMKAGGRIKVRGRTAVKGDNPYLKLLVKLAFFVYILGQDGTHQRLLLLTLGAALIFLAQTGRLEFVNRIMDAVPTFQEAPPPPPRPEDAPFAFDAPPRAEGDDANGVAGDAPADADAAGPPQPPQPPQPPAEPEGSFLLDLRDLAGAFFASMLPTYRVDPRARDGEWERFPDQPPMGAGPGANF